MKFVRSYWWVMLIVVCISMGGLIACQDDESSTPATPSATPTPEPTATPGVCTGLSYEGVCWHLTAQNQSCDSLCPSFGGVDTSALSFWAGRTPEECHTLTTSLGANVSNGIGNGVDPYFDQYNCWYYGCIAEVGVRFRTYLCLQTPQDTSWSDEGGRVVCPCNN